MHQPPLECEPPDRSGDSIPSPLDLVGSLELLPQPTLEFLPCQEFYIQPETTAGFLLRAFEENSHLSGAMVRQDGQMVGVISRRLFLLHMSQLYSAELYLERPILRFLQMYAADTLELPSCCHIDAAIHHALDRPSQYWQEPIVVCGSSGTHKLLDIHTLLLAQSELLRQTRKLQQKTEAALRLANQKLELQATRDGLTGVANRRKFERDLEREWQRQLRDGQPLALILCDVDHFKCYNDTYGHQAGDKCLRSVALTLQQSLKRPSDLVARYGGEEFAVLLPDTPLTGAQQVASELRDAIEKLFLPHDASSVSNCVTISLGVCASIPSADLLPEHLLQIADEALYEAKSAGRNCFISKTLSTFEEPQKLDGVSKDIALPAL